MKEMIYIYPILTITTAVFGFLVQGQTTYRAVFHCRGEGESFLTIHCKQCIEHGEGEGRVSTCHPSGCSTFIRHSRNKRYYEPCSRNKCGCTQFGTSMLNAKCYYHDGKEIEALCQNLCFGGKCFTDDDF